MNGVDDKQYVTIELHDAQLERLEALIERNLARQEAIAANMRADIAELKGDIKALDAKVDGVEKKMDARFEGVMDAIALTNTRIDDLQTKQSISLAKWGIIIAVTVGVVQVITSIVLRYI